MANDDSSAKDRRETKAAKQQERAREGGEARTGYDAVQQATVDKTASLKNASARPGEGGQETLIEQSRLQR
jgi:hypothetical protein